MIRRFFTAERQDTALCITAAVLFALVAAGASGALMERLGSPFWAELAVAELVTVGVLLGSFDLLTRRRSARTDDDLLAEQDAAVQAHQDGTCGCPSPRVMLADCDRWNDALTAAAEQEATR